MTTDKIKKEFQKVINTIRKENGDSYPKAIMTAKQMETSTATVNCGGEWRDTQYTVMTSNMVMEDTRFQEFLTKANATARIEADKFGGFQIRINY